MFPTTNLMDTLPYFFSEEEEWIWWQRRRWSRRWRRRWRRRCCPTLSICSVSLVCVLPMRRVLSRFLSTVIYLCCVMCKNLYPFSLFI
jgi:hypothetical protein